MLPTRIFLLVFLRLATPKSLSKTNGSSSSFKTVLSRYRPLFNVSSYEDIDVMPAIYQTNSGESEWPKGTYGLPKPMSGCPSDINRWNMGWRYHDTENSMNENGFSKQLHIDGSVTEEGILHKFCIKTYTSGSYNWPKGRYCFYQYNFQCPYETKPGYIFWDDENTNNHNRNAGTLPSGSYSIDTEIRFCCRIDGDTSKPISLPLKSPFYLFPYLSANCQKVVGMNSNIEFIKFDNEDTNNSNSQAGEYPYGIDPTKEDIYLYMCYYTPENIKTTEIPVSQPEAHPFTGQSKISQLEIMYDDTDKLQLDSRVNTANFSDENVQLFSKTNILSKKLLYILLFIGLILVLIITVSFIYPYFKNSTKSIKREAKIIPKMNVPKGALNTFEFPEFDNDTDFDNETPLVYDHSLDRWGGGGRQINAMQSRQSRAP